MKNKLETQISSDHEIKKVFRCEICGKIFTNKKGLMQHMDGVHNGNKPFKCDICDKSFSQKRDMNRHVASVHDGKKPFKCDICEYKCSLNQQMKQHVTKSIKKQTLICAPQFMYIRKQYMLLCIKIHSFKS